MDEVSILQAVLAREFPELLDEIELGVIGRQEVGREAFGALLPPPAVEPSMLVFRIVTNDHGALSGSRAGRPKMLERWPEGEGVEFFRLATEVGFVVALAYSTKIPDPPSSEMTEWHRILGFRRHPRPAIQPVSLEVRFAYDLKFNPEIGT